jgi:hypothetical protein
MHGYRIYFIGDDGHIKDRIEFGNPDDDEAREHARQLTNGRDVEVWRGDHRIVVFKRSDIASHSSRAGWLRFFTLVQNFCGPPRYGRSRCFETFQPDATGGAK